ncbi:hypothetical protein M0802_015536 [Mischocyttarus mexicanus]|nr:hypothetical protein M0802_015536 [Mischocyttarus mexicanus]
MKVFTKILSEVVAQTGISEEKQGFQKNRSTTDAIFILRQIAEKAIEFNKIAFVCFVDLEKAFDNGRLTDVLKILRQRNMDPNISAIIRKLNTDNACYIKAIGDLTKQGDMTLILFNVILDEIISEEKTTGRGYRIGNREIKLVAYADDVLISEDEDNLQRIMYKFETITKKFNLNISVQKTKLLTISKEPRLCKLAVNELRVKQRNKGTNKKSSNGINCKTRIYKTCARQIMSYAIETRAETAATKRLLRNTEMRTLRTITGKTLFDHQSNDDIRRKWNMQDIVRWARQRRRVLAR